MRFSADTANCGNARRSVVGATLAWVRRRLPWLGPKVYLATLSLLNHLIELQLHYPPYPTVRYVSVLSLFCRIAPMCVFYAGSIIF